MTETIDALWLAVEQSPDDWDRYRVLADALYDAGEERLERAVRWMVRQGKRPEYLECLQETNPWVWYDTSRYTCGGEDMLPAEFFEGEQWAAKCQKTLIAAVSWLADQLERMGM